MAETFYFSIAKDFSRFPAGRTKADGPFSGEHLREILLPRLRAGRVVLNLDGTMGYGSSFLEGAFGGIGGHHELEIESKDPTLVQEIRSYVCTREELIADRDALLDALLPLAIGLTCIKTKGFGFMRDPSVRCGECPVCRAYDTLTPVVKWVRKGYKSW